MEETVTNEDVFAVMESVAETCLDDNSGPELLGESVQKLSDLMLGE